LLSLFGRPSFTECQEITLTFFRAKETQKQQDGCQKSNQTFERMISPEGRGSKGKVLQGKMLT
jgi:hypothetical protein